MSKWEVNAALGIRMANYFNQKIRIFSSGTTYAALRLSSNLRVFWYVKLDYVYIYNEIIGCYDDAKYIEYLFNIKLQTQCQTNNIYGVPRQL